MDAIATISFVSAVCALVDFGAQVVGRLKEFNDNAGELPRAFIHISQRLPLLIDAVDRPHEQSKNGSLSSTTETALRPVADGIHM